MALALKFINYGGVRNKFQTLTGSSPVQSLNVEGITGKLGVNCIGKVCWILHLGC